jgi:hypothetical protein
MMETENMWQGNCETGMKREVWRYPFLCIVKFNIQKFYFLSTKCISVFRMALRKSSD